MSVSLSKGQRVDLTKGRPSLKKHSCWTWMGY